MVISHQYLLGNYLFVNYYSISILNQLDSPLYCIQISNTHYQSYFQSNFNVFLAIHYYNYLSIHYYAIGFNFHHHQSYFISG